jgi:glycosyltransferase involved in cell wall biosynthesis
MKIEYCSHINTTGYGKAAKDYIIKLKSMKHHVSVKTIGPIQLFDTPEDNLVKSMIDSDIGKPDVRIIHAVPHPHLSLNAIKNDGVFTIWFYAWELAILPPMYMDILNKVEHCVTFAKWQVETYQHCMGKDNISYIPHIVKNDSNYEKRTWHSPLTFLSVFRWDERKDPSTLIKSFLYAFDGSLDSVRLVLKVADIKKEAVEAGISQIMKISRLGKQFPSIQAICGCLTEAEMNDLYQEADIFVSTTRGEGWGLGFNEALSRGIPVIYPDHPYLVKSFFNQKNSIPVPARNALVYNSSFPQVTGEMVWGQVDEIALINTFRTVYRTHRERFVLPVYLDQNFIDEQHNMDIFINEILAKVR